MEDKYYQDDLDNLNNDSLKTIFAENIKREISLGSTLYGPHKDDFDININGHSIECRINAENPKTFKPSPGKITQYHQPGGLGIRVESALFQGYSIPPHYDSMIAKLITYGKNRDESILKMKKALEEYVIMGIENTIQLNQDILKSEDFVSGKYNVNFMNEQKVN